MADDRESRAGIFFGIVAGVMLIALTIMALTTLVPARASAPHYAIVSLSTQAVFSDIG